MSEKYLNFGDLNKFNEYRTSRTLEREKQIIAKVILQIKQNWSYK